jgi:hypothetical protein
MTTMCRDDMVDHQPPVSVKDLIEEQLFAHRCDLFSELSVVFLDTTSLRFAGSGGQHSKDHRPDPMQMIVGVVIDADGRPVCSEIWPGTPRTSPCSSPSSTACARASPSAGSASWPAGV